MCFSAGPADVLSPERAVKMMEVRDMFGLEQCEFLRTTCFPRQANLDCVVEELNGQRRPVVFHGFSMSGFLWGNALLSMDRDPARFAPFKENLCAQVNLFLAKLAVLAMTHC